MSGSVKRLLSIIGGLVGIFAVDAAVLQWKTGNPQWSVIARELEVGCTFALTAAGVVLIYRASRVINFATAGFGIVSGALFYELLTYTGLTYWLTLPASILVGALLGGVIELAVIRRFGAAARLVLTVVTIGAAQLLAGIGGTAKSLLHDKREYTVPTTTPLTHFAWRWGHLVFTGNDVVLVVLTAAALIGLALFFRFTNAGIAVRGAAENGDRAALLGINTGSLSTLVWVIAGVLSALAVVLFIPIFGYNGNASAGQLGLGTFLPAVAAAVIAGMESVPLAIAAAFGVALFEQVVYTIWTTSAVVDLALFFLFLVVFLFLRKRLARTDETAASTWAATEEVRPIPAELAGVASVRSLKRWFLGLLALVILGYPFVMSPSQTNTGSFVLISGIVIISLVVLVGWGGQISLGQWALAAVGAVVGGSLSAHAHWPFLLALLAGSLAGAAVAALMGVASLRVRGTYLAVTTLAGAVAMATFGLNRKYVGSFLPTRITRPVLLFVKTDNERVFYYVCLLALMLAWVAAQGLRISRTGRVLIAMRDNERGAQAFGVNLVRTRLVTFAISGFMAAAAGVLYAYHQHAVNNTQYPPEQSVQIFLTAIIGGLGSIQGALLGSVYFVIIDLAIKGAIGRLLASSVGVLLVLMFFPGGLGSLAYKGRDAVLRRIAIRRRIYVPSLLADYNPEGRTDRAPIAPKPDVDGRAAVVPVRYRKPSRIRVAGASQVTKRWSF